MNQLRHMDRIKASYELFDKLECRSQNLNGNFNDDAALALVQEEKMRCHIMNCLAALSIVEIQRMIKKKFSCFYEDLDEHELVKRKVFKAACLMMMDAEFDNNDEIVVSATLASFPDDSKMSDKRSWLPLHFAIMLFAQDKISAEDVYLLHTTDLLAMYRLSELDCADDDEEFEPLIGWTPAHLLCMQKEPNMEMVRYFCLRDPKAFLLLDQKGRNTLHLAAEYSESVELLQAMLQIDPTMAKKDIASRGWAQDDSGWNPIGLLCKRLEFPAFLDMVACLISVDSCVDVIYDGIVQCLQSYCDSESKYHHIRPGSRGERTMILLGILLNANPDALTCNRSWIFHCACRFIRGKLGVAVLSLFLEKDNTLVRSLFSLEYLPIHGAIVSSSLDVVKLLQKAYPESLSMVTSLGATLLHLVFEIQKYSRDRSDIVHTWDKVLYLCEMCPTLIHEKNKNGETPLQHALGQRSHLSIRFAIWLCNVDATVVKEKCTPLRVTHPYFGRLPLHFLISNNPPRSEISKEADCFRLFLRLYPTSAGMRDDHSESPYDLAVSQNLSAYFLRRLLCADPTIDPIERRNLNFAARRDGMFLAFRALSTNMEPSIWSKIRYEDKDILAIVISYL